MPLRTLFYRYLFFGWLFRDASRGNRLERAAAWRHNRDQARWLPTYMRRWLGWGLMMALLGTVVELGLGTPLVSAVFYMSGVLAVPINAVIGVAWIGLKALPGPA